MIFKDKEEYVSRIGGTLITAEQITAAVKECAEKIDGIYDGRPLLMIGVLNGAAMFVSELMKHISVPCELEFIQAKSYYDSTESSGEVKLTREIERDISGYHVLLAEDIIDTGRTLCKVKALLESKDPLSVTTITLLDKPERRLVDFTPDISLFTIEDVFVIGFGLDCAGYYRNLPFIAEYKE